MFSKIKNFHIKRVQIITPILLMTSFFVAVQLQIYYENTVMAEEIKLRSKLEKDFNIKYKSLAKLAIEKGFKSEKAALIVNFWASWCNPCIQEFKSLRKALKKFSHLEVLGVNQDSDVKTFKKAEKKHKLEFFSFLDKNTKIADDFGITEYPYTILYCHGKVSAIYSGETDFMSRRVRKKIKACK